MPQVFLKKFFFPYILSLENFTKEAGMALSFMLKVIVLGIDYFL